VPWLPQGKDESATNFPKATDEAIQEIINEDYEPTSGLPNPSGGAF